MILSILNLFGLFLPKKTRRVCKLLHFFVIFWVNGTSLKRLRLQMATKIITLFKDIIGIINSPGQVLGRLMREKNWVPVFILILAAAALFTYITFPIQIARLAESAEASGYLPEEQILYLQSNPSFTLLMTCALKMFGMFLGFVVAAFFVYLFFGIGGSEGYYVNFFSLVVNASIIDILIPEIIETVSILLNINLLIFFNAAIFLPTLKPEHFSHLLLTQVTLFSLWYMIALALGVAAFSKMNFKKCLFISILYFVFKSVIQASFAYLLFRISPLY